VLLAFNTLGWQSQNFLFNAIDAIIGSPSIDEAFGASPLADVSAYADQSALTATNGGISVQAIEQAQISATTGNATTSLASGLANQNGAAVGVLLATNMVNAQANAYLTSTPAEADGGALSVVGKDDAEISATNDQAVSSTSVSTPQGLLLSYLGNVVNDYQFTSSSGSQVVAPGDLV
jgi:hypothetical protein